MISARAVSDRASASKQKDCLMFLVVIGSEICKHGPRNSDKQKSMGPEGRTGLERMFGRCAQASELSPWEARAGVQAPLLPHSEAVAAAGLARSQFWDKFRVADARRMGYASAKLSCQWGDGGIWNAQTFWKRS